MATELPDLDKECFFITPIGKEGSSERKRSDGVLEFIVARAAEELGLTAVRADQIAEPGQITLQVIEHVLGARAAVVDLTGLNPNVFYELAVRHTARLPVALIAEKDCTLPFDIAQMRTIFFDHTDLKSADECRRSIASHLREALEKGAVDSPIATTIDVRTLQAGSVVERNIADLVTSVEEMAKAQRSIISELEHGRMRGEFNHPAIIDLVHGFERLEIEAREGGDERALSTLGELAPVIEFIGRRAGLRARQSLITARRERELAARARRIQAAEEAKLEETLPDAENSEIE